MMQRSVSIFIGVILSVLVAYGGSGVNAYFFCCGECLMEGTAAPVEHSCCGSAHQANHYDSIGCEVNHDGCGVERITFDWQWFQANPIQLQPIVTDLDDCLFSSVTSDPYAVVLPFSSCDGNRRTQHPPNLSKKEYFSLLSSLII